MDKINQNMRRYTLARTIEFIVGNARLSLRFSQADMEVLQFLSQTVAVDAEAVAGTGGFDEARCMRRSAFLSALDYLMDSLGKTRASIPSTYSFRIAEGTFAGYRGSGIVKGIKLAREEEHEYSIEGGFNLCTLTKWQIGTGDAHLVDVSDIRQLSALRTRNMGEIRIIHKKKRLNLGKTLPRLREFVASQEAEWIQMRLTSD
jgi:hypothetical protein